jgi:hypothetical protein
MYDHVEAAASVNHEGPSCRPVGISTIRDLRGFADYLHQMKWSIPIG